MTAEPPLNLNSFLTYRMARVQAKLNAQGARILKEVAGLSLAQWRILLILGSHGDMPSAEVSRTAELDKGLLSRKLKRLIDDGFVQGTQHPTDKRVQIMSLTTAGRELYLATLPHMQARQMRLRGLLAEDELTAFYSALDKIEAALEQEADE